MVKMKLKKFLKRVVDIIFLILVMPVYVYQKIADKVFRSDRNFAGISQMLSLIPGLVGCYMRKNYYRLSMTHCDKDCAILFGTIFSHADTEIGKGVYIGPNCNIGRCKIEQHCTLGSNVHILSGKEQHQYNDLDTPIQEQGGVFKKIIVGEDTWVGNCSVVLADLGKKCIVGAGSIVVKEVDSYSVVAGNPVRTLKKRK